MKERMKDFGYHMFIYFMGMGLGMFIGFLIWGVTK
jgi:hypothetical protein